MFSAQRRFICSTKGRDKGQRWETEEEGEEDGNKGEERKRAMERDKELFVIGGVDKESPLDR